MYEMKQLKGKVKENDLEGWKELKGMEFVFVHLPKIDKDRYLVIRPIDLEEMKKFYKYSYEDMGKEWISSDYNYFIWYMINEDCELSSHIPIEYVEDSKELTEEDIIKHNKNLEELKKLHKFYEFERQYTED